MLLATSLLLGGIYTPITSSSNCLKYSVISIIYSFILLTAPTCFSHCSSTRIPTPEPFFLSSAALDQYPTYLLFAAWVKNLPSLSVRFVSVIHNIVISSSSAQLSKFPSFHPLVLSPLML